MPNSPILRKYTTLTRKNAFKWHVHIWHSKMTLLRECTKGFVSLTDLFKFNWLKSCHIPPEIKQLWKAWRLLFLWWMNEHNTQQHDNGHCWNIYTITLYICKCMRYTITVEQYHHHLAKSAGAVFKSIFMIRIFTYCLFASLDLKANHLSQYYTIILQTNRDPFPSVIKPFRPADQSPLHGYLYQATHLFALIAHGRLFSG